jgi:4-aminobutyrate aminotransferase-like enzyme
MVCTAGASQLNVLNTNTRYLHHSIIEYANHLLKYFPPSLCVVHIVNSGSEANELAMRMAKTHTKQRDIVALEVGYHGNTQACIDVSSYKFDGRGGQGKPEHTHILPLPDSYRGLYKGEDTGWKYASHLKIIFEELSQKNRKIAAFIGESIVSCGGQIVLPYHYLQEVYRLIREQGGLCIADEVQTGFGRVGKKFWAFELHDVIPDIVTLGKPMGNGHPLAAVVCTKAVAESFANGMEFFNTYGGNPVSCEIGQAVLKVIETEALQDNALHVGNFLKQELKRLQNKYEVIGDVRGEGLFLGVEFAIDHTPLPKHTSYIVQRMKDLKVLMSIDGKDHNVIKIKPPMIFSMKDARYLIESMETIMQEIE